MATDSGRERKRKMTATSIFNRSGSGTTSLTSHGSSVLSKIQKEMMGSGESFQGQELLLLLSELLLGFTWQCFIAREKSEKTLELRGKTPREDTMETLFWLGWASLGNIIVGQVMDSFTSHYFMALLNVTLHFSLASFFLIGEVIHETSSEDVYALLLSHIFLWSTPPIKALGFSRYVYAMDQSAGKGAIFIMHYTFLFNLSQLLGTFMFTVLLDTAPSTAILAVIAFFFSGTVLFVFSYLVRPRRHLQTTAPPRELALQVWGIIFTALRNKRKFKKKVALQNWLEYAENRYDRGAIVITRRLFRVFLMASPTAGFLMFTVNSNVIFKEFHHSLKLTGIGMPGYFKWIISSMPLLVVIGIEYLLVPLLQAACKFKINFLKRFLLGYISVVIAILAASLISTATEKVSIRRGLGILRVHNTMEKGNVTFTSKQLDFTKLRFIVFAKTSISVSFAASEQNLFRMAVKFSSREFLDDEIRNVTTYAQLFSVAPEEVLQYVAIAPSTILRIPGFVPVKEGPPGQNAHWKPRIYMVSLVRDRVQSVFLMNEATEQRIVIEVPPGQVKVFQVEEGKYMLQYTSSITRQIHVMMGAGGLYGIYLFLGLNQYEIDVDKIIGENTNHGMLALIVSIPMMIARGIGQVALDSFVYTTAPEGLKGLAFGFYMWCAHLTAWFILVGFYTWHRYITPEIMGHYAIIAAVTFLFCFVLLTKYRNHYNL